MNWISPVNYGKISSGYTERIDPLNRLKKHFHHGIDIVAINNDRFIRMPVDGILQVSGYSSSYGFRYWFLLNDGTFLILAHFSILNERLLVFSEVKAGTGLGWMGSSGWSNGVHLHLGIESSMDGKGISYCPIDVIKCFDPTFVPQFKEMKRI